MGSTRVDGTSVEILPGLPEPWPDLVRAFLVETYLRGQSRRTADEYARIIARFLATIDDPCLVGPMAVRAFAYAPVGPAIPPAAATVGVRLAALNGLFTLAVQARVLTVNPVAGIRRPRCSPPPPRGIAASDIRRLLASIPDDHAGTRDRAIVTLIVLTGLRRSEALGIRRADLDLAAGVLEVRVKGGRLRGRFMPTPVVDAIDAWLTIALPGPPDEPLFGIGPEAFYASLRRRARAIGLDGCTPHALRHSAAQLRRGSGASIEEVSALLGHASLATTARYLRRSEPEADDGWRGAAEVLGIGDNGRLIRPSRTQPGIRAGPCDRGGRAGARTPVRPERQEGRMHPHHGPTLRPCASRRDPARLAPGR